MRVKIKIYVTGLIGHDPDESLFPEQEIELSDLENNIRKFNDNDAWVYGHDGRMVRPQIFKVEINLIP